MLVGDLLLCVAACLADCFLTVFSCCLVILVYMAGLFVFACSVLD